MRLMILVAEFVRIWTFRCCVSRLRLRPKARIAWFSKYLTALPLPRFGEVSASVPGWINSGAWARGPCPYKLMGGRLSSSRPASLAARRTQGTSTRSARASPTLLEAVSRAAGLTVRGRCAVAPRPTLYFPHGKPWPWTDGAAWPTCLHGPDVMKIKWENIVPVGFWWTNNSMASRLQDRSRRS